MSTSKKKVTIANLLSVVGGVLMFLFVFCGNSILNYENSLGECVLTALLTVLGAVIFLWLAVHAKGVENNFGWWKIVEVLSLVLFLGVAVLSSKNIIHYFSVSNNTEVLKNVARDDLKEVNKMITDFQNKESERLQKEIAGVELACNGGYELSNEVETFLDDNKIEDSNDIDARKDVRSDEIKNVIDNEGKTYLEPWNKERKELEAIVENWNMLKMGEAIKRFNSLHNGVKKKLNEISKSRTYVSIEANDSAVLVLNKQLAPEYSSSTKLTTLISATPAVADMPVMAFVAVIGINLLLLSSYIFAYRSRKVAPKGKKCINGGAPL